MPRWAAQPAPEIRARFPDRSASASDSVGPPRPRRVAVVLRWCCGAVAVGVAVPRVSVTTGHSRGNHFTRGESEMPRNRPRRRRPLDRHHERAAGHLAGTAEPRRAACVADRAARPEPPGGPLSPSGCESRTVSRRHPVGFFNPRLFPRWRRRPRAGQHCRHIVTRRSSHAPAPKPFPGGAPLSGPVRDSYKFGVPPDVSELGHCVPRARRLPSWLA
jgi:hypothetical protein